MKVLLSLFMLCSFAWTYAHTIWLETKNTGKTNQTHEIRIFFGEPDEAPTPAAKWFSNLKDLELKIISPTGKEFLIKEKTQQTDYYSAFFTPTEKGTYKISVRHLVADVYNKHKITYQSVTFVNVDAKNEVIRLGSTPLEVQFSNNTPKIGESKTIQLLSSGMVKAKGKLKIASENGWEKNLYSNEKGEVFFKPIWKGKYLLEYVNSQQISGQHNGKAYDTDYEVLTYMIDVQ